MIADYASSESIHDLDACWQEVREGLDALIWLEKKITSVRDCEEYEREDGNEG